GLAETALNAGPGAVVLADKSPGWRAHDAEQVLYIERYGGLKPLRRLIKARAVHRFVSRRPTIICDSWKSLEYLSPLDAPITVLAHGDKFPARPSQMKTKRITKTLAKAS